MKTLPILVAAVMTAGALTGNAVARDLNYATFVPPASGNNTLALQPAFDSIAKETNGELTFKLFAGGQLLGGKDMLPGLRDGIADAGFVASSYFVSDLPHASIISDMMGFGRDPIAVAGASLETQLLDCQQCQQDYADHDVLYLTGHVPTEYRLLCGGPVASLKDIHGLRVRGGGPAMARTAEAMGTTPINMSAGDMYEAMERGQLDCVVGPIAWLKQYGLHDVVKTVIGEPLGVVGGLGLVVFNQRSWDDLTADQKHIVLRQMPFITAQATINGYMKDDQTVRAKYEGQIKFIDAVPEIRTELDSINQASLDLIAKAAMERGVKNPKPIMDTYLANIEKWNRISAEQIKGDPAKLEQILWDEIFSKLKL